MYIFLYICISTYTPLAFFLGYRKIISFWFLSFCLGLVNDILKATLIFFICRNIVYNIGFWCRAIAP